MPSLGFGEILLLLIAGVLLIKPEDLPKFLRRLGEMYTDAQRSIAKFRSYTESTFDEITRIPDNSVTGELGTEDSNDSNVDKAISNEAKESLSDSETEEPVR